MQRILLALASLVMTGTAQAQRLEGCPAALTTTGVARQLALNDGALQSYSFGLHNASPVGVYLRVSLAQPVAGLQPDNDMVSGRRLLLRHNTGVTFRVGQAERRPYPGTSQVAAAVVVACEPQRSLPPP